MARLASIIAAVLFLSAAHLTPAQAAVAAPLVASVATSHDSADMQLVADKGGGKKWFAFWFPESLKPKLEEKKWPLAAVSFLFFSVGGGVWAPILLAGAEFNLEWALPVIVYWVPAAIGLFMCVFMWWAYTIPFWIGLTLMGVFGYLGTMTMIANVNRPEIPLKNK